MVYFLTLNLMGSTFYFDGGDLMFSWICGREFRGVVSVIRIPFFYTVSLGLAIDLVLIRRPGMFFRILNLGDYYIITN